MSRLIKLHAIILVLVVSLANCQNSTIDCHYSCKQCVGESYTLCSVCLQDKNITVVEDPTVSDPQYINSNVKTGVCTGDVPPKVNALGVLLVIICSAVAGVVRTPSSIYLISTLQTISLISFVEVAWVYPVGYLLQSLQYFMIFNWMGSGYKVQDQTMRQRQYYRLDLYMHESGFMRNIAIVGLADLALVIAIIVLGIWKYRKDKGQKYQAGLQVCPEKSEKLQINSQQMSQAIYKKEPNLFQTILETILKICVTAFFLLIQETSLVIMTSLRFERPIPLAAKAVPIIYCIFLLGFLVYTFFNQLWFFPNRQTQLLGIWRKIGLPVLTIVPYKVTFLIVAFLLGFVILESFFDFKGGKQKILSRITFFKLVELIVVILSGAYILTELSRNIELQTNIIRVFLSIGIIAFFACFFIELFFGIIETYFTKNNQVDNQNQGKQNVFQPENNTLENIQPHQEEKEKNKDVMIIDIQDDQIEQNPHENQNKLKNSLKITQTIQKNKVLNNSFANGSFNYKSENTDETDKAAREKQEAQRRRREEQENARKKKQLEQQEAEKRRQQELEAERRRKQQLEAEKRRRQQLQAEKKRKQEEAQRKKQEQIEAARKKKEQEARRKEQQQLQARRKKEEEEARKKKEKQQLAAKLKKQQEEDEAQRKKQQEQFEARLKQIRRKKYEAKKDEDLRKRYGA